MGRGPQQTLRQRFTAFLTLDFASLPRLTGILLGREGTPSERANTRQGRAILRRGANVPERDNSRHPHAMRRTTGPTTTTDEAIPVAHCFRLEMQYFGCATPFTDWHKAKPMRSQPFAAFVLLSATVGIPAVVSSAALAEPAEKEATRTDRYGDPLPKGAIMRLGTARFAQPSPSNLVFSPDGKYLISAGGEKRIRLWDPDTGKELRSLEGHQNGVRWISLSADGKLLASCGGDEEVILWELETGKIRLRFQELVRRIHLLSLSPNGKVLATSDVHALRLRDTDSGKETLSLPSPGRRGGAEAAVFTPDSKQLAFAERLNQDIHLLDVASGKPIRTFKGHKGRVYQLIFTPDGTTLFSCSFDHTIRSWDVASGKEKQRYGDEKQTVGCFALAPDGKSLTYSTGFLVHIWDLAANKDRGTPHQAKAWISPGIAYSPDSKKVAVGGENIAIYDTATGKRLNPDLDNGSPIHQIKYALGGKLLLVWRWYDKAIELWDMAKGQKTHTLRPKIGYFGEMIVSPNGKYLTTGEGDSFQGKHRVIICTWDLQSGKRLKEFPLKSDSWFDSLSYSADGKTLRYQQIDSRSRDFVVRDAATGEELKRESALERLPATIHRQPEWKPLLAPDGKVLVWGASPDAAGLWDAKTGQLVRSFGGRWMGFLIPPVISPDGRTIAVLGNVGKKDQVPLQPEILLYEMATGKERLHIAPNDRQLKKQIAFSSDSRLLASAGEGETIQVWDAWTGKEVARFSGHRGPIKTLSFAPDSKTLASGGEDRTVLIWDVSGLAPAKPEKEKLSRERLAECWDNLADSDAARAYATIVELARHPNQTESLLKDKLPAYSGRKPQHLPRLIADLDSDDFKTRENASKELANLGQSAEGALRKALEEKPSAELKRRLEELLARLNRTEDDPERVRLLRAIEVLERIDTPEARRLLRKLAKEASDPNAAREAQASLERLAKTEKDAP